MLRQQGLKVLTRLLKNEPCTSPLLHCYSKAIGVLLRVSFDSTGLPLVITIEN